MMAVFENFPYTNFHEINLDWVISKVTEYVAKFDDLEDFVNKTVEEQNALIEQALIEISEGMQELRDYITENLRVIANEIINELIESGELYIGTSYDAETEELSIVLSREGE